MKRMIRNAGLAAIAATTFVTSAAVPAMAGDRERDFLKGVAATVIVGAIANEVIKNSNGVRRQQPVRQQYYQPQQPQYFASQPVHAQPTYTQPVRHAQPSIYSIPAAQTFNEYSARDRRDIQAELARYGYYTGSIDGKWGPGTHRAVQAYARDSRQSDALDSRRSAYGLYDTLILG